MSFNIIQASRTITETYKRYLKTMFDIIDPESESDPCFGYKKMFEKELSKMPVFSKGPYLEVTNSFKTGRTMEQLVNDGILHPDFRNITNLYNRKLYIHQEQALLKIQKGNNIVVSTGTGSGKTECFLIPIIDSLMKEKEAKGKIEPGVRALIIFPMNALANDQTRRFREIFRNYPDITFGSYTGQTPAKDKWNKNDCDKLPNEIATRDKIKENPPHILITNYAMLEYLMLRPEDSVLFDGPFANKWHFIVLDEAHTYTGSTGIEVSMLMRRVLAKLGNPKIQFILTSATLGSEDENEDVARFANELCNAPFDENDIIRAQRINLAPRDYRSMICLGTTFYENTAKLIDQGYQEELLLNQLDDDYNLKKESKNASDYLYNLLINDKTFWKVKNFLTTTKSIVEIKEYLGWNQKTISDFVQVASLANKNGSKLFDARYHLFIRATDSIFITLAPHKNLFLERKDIDISNSDNDEQYKVFEAMSCKQCHTLYLVGQKSKDGILEQKSNSDPDSETQVFMLGSVINDSDDEDSLSSMDEEADVWEICPHCGYLRPANEVNKTSCGHPEKDFVKVIKVNSSETGRITKCIRCENVNRRGILRGFFSGQEASTSVIGTSLFELLPSSEKVITHYALSDDQSGFSIQPNIETVENPKAKQFLAFSDNRQAAAYFASYFSASYQELLYGRIICETIKDMSNNKMPLFQFIENLSASLKNHDVSAAGLDTDYEKEACKAILKELVDNKSSTSLISLGLLNIGLNVEFENNAAFGLTKEEIETMSLVFVSHMLSDCAISCDPMKRMTDADDAYFSNGGQLFYKKKLDKISKKCKSFFPINETRSNKRIDYIGKVLSLTKPSLVSTDAEKRNNSEKLLNGFWEHLFTKSRPLTLLSKNADWYKVNLNALSIRKNAKWYICSKCHRITAYNIHNVCPTYKCNGTLKEIDVSDFYKDNHYYKMYNDLPICNLRVAEHTAQLSKEKAEEYQNDFVDKKIDVLSCSTTFEMGVDVGTLETVFMRNVPPAPSNYSQRAGRAGRSTKTAAFALTFCNRSNHDFNFFREPKEMINGLILPPNFKLDNDKIGIRHIYSSAFSFFWRECPLYFNDVSGFFEKNTLSGLVGYNVFKKYLYSKPEKLKSYLLASVPDSLKDKLGIDSFSWLDSLFCEDIHKPGLLFIAKSRYEYEVKSLKDKLYADNDLYKSTDYLKRRIKTYREEQIISFLSKNSILPKYGFPVDTVELKTSSDHINKNELQLSRDLSMAITEYAPGCQIVADKLLYTSRYINKVPAKEWRLYDFASCPKCHTLTIELHDKHTDLSTCKSCGQSISGLDLGTFIIPEFGFSTETSKPKTPSLSKPERSFHTEVAFVDYFEKEKVQEENSFDLGSTVIKLTSISNGSMAILNTEQFLVCDKCGFSIEVKEGIPISHETHNGYPCDGKLQRYSLGYRFETDVIKININIPCSYDEAYSVLQAIILAASDVLRIDEKEINGCIQFVRINNEDGYNFILFDSTPGGAGYVSQLNNKESILHVLVSAYNRAKQCTCGGPDGDSSCYSCLRTYRNQRKHDKIKRKYVIDYLEIVLSDYRDPSFESDLEHSFIYSLSKYGFVITSKPDGNTTVYYIQANENKWKVSLQQYLDLENNVVKPCRPDFIFQLVDNKLNPISDTKHKTICVFADGFSFHNNKVDDDSIKRDALNKTGHFRVWSLSYNDVQNAYQEQLDYYTKTIDSEKNSLDLLCDYLASDNSENDFIQRADSYFTNLLESSTEITSNGKDTLESIVEQYQFNISETNFKQWKVFSPNQIDPQFSVLFSKNGDENIAISYLQDFSIKTRYKLEWNGFWLFNNYMQFINNLLIITENGLRKEDYSILNNIPTTNTSLHDDQLNTALSLASTAEAKEVMKNCISNKIELDTIGYELDDASGAQAEIAWKDEKVVYLTAEQQKFADRFSKKGWKVAYSIDEILEMLGGNKKNG